MNTNNPNTPNPADLRPKSGLRSRLFAKLMAGEDAHDAAIAPYKRMFLSELQGNVLEIGPGSGPNLIYYAPDVHWIGVEPNPYMHDYLRARAASQGRTVDLRTGHAEALPAADQSMDAVVSTLVLCSVHDLDFTLAEIKRVLKPGGRFVFIEHVAAQAETGLRRVQNFLRPVWSAIGDGCHPNREIEQALEKADFASLHIEHFDTDIPVIKPHIAGYALK
jgi:ubiquinone/menaquinone biosynthesis C-methylase UbiE